MSQAYFGTASFAGAQHSANNCIDMFCGKFT